MTHARVYLVAVRGDRSHRPRTTIFDHLLKGSKSFKFLNKDVYILQGYVLCYWDECWENSEKSGRFDQFQGVPEFERCSAWIKQEEWGRKKKQGMDESSIVVVLQEYSRNLLEITVTCRLARFVSCSLSSVVVIARDIL